MKKIKKADFKFSGYLVFMFLTISLLGIFGTLIAASVNNYDVESSAAFDNYLNTFDRTEYADQNKLKVAKSDSESELALYESSFTFGEQIVQTQNETEVFVKATSDILGLPSEVWFVIVSVVVIFFLVAIVFFLRGLKE